MHMGKLTAVAAMALAAAACGGSGDAGNDMSTDLNLANDAAANEVLGANAADGNQAAALPTDASGFATAVAATDLYEIQSAELAASKATSAELKEFAGHVRTDHQSSTAQLKTAAAEAKVTVTPALDAEKERMLDQLKGASGAEFDRLFLEQQQTAHQKALSVLQNYASGGDAEPLKAFAGKAVKIVQGHIDHLNSIKLQ